MIKYLSICKRAEFEEILGQDEEYLQLVQDLHKSEEETVQLCKDYTKANRPPPRLLRSEKRRNYYKASLDNLLNKVDELKMKHAKEAKLARMERSELRAQKKLATTEINDKIKESQSKTNQLLLKMDRYSKTLYKKILAKRRKELRDEY
ncbi:MAG: hypothetical protein JRJ68_03310 [Deltaproteobacteria bacterium]|nr:hypothetical protein [Deltaproteobacteria bacterium]